MHPISGLLNKHERTTIEVTKAKSLGSVKCLSSSKISWLFSSVLKRLSLNNQLSHHNSTRHSILIALFSSPSGEKYPKGDTAQNAPEHKSEVKSLTKLHVKQTIVSFTFPMNIHAMPQQVKLITFNDHDEMRCTENLFSIFTLLNANKPRLPRNASVETPKEIHYVKGDNFSVCFCLRRRIEKNKWKFFWLSCNCFTRETKAKATVRASKLER